MTQKQDWDDWVDVDALGREPLRLREDAPEEMKLPAASRQAAGYL